MTKKFNIWDRQEKRFITHNESSLNHYSNWGICPFTGRLSNYVGTVDGDHGDGKLEKQPNPSSYINDEGKVVNEDRYVLDSFEMLARLKEPYKDRRWVRIKCINKISGIIKLEEPRDGFCVWHTEDVEIQKF